MTEADGKRYHLEHSTQWGLRHILFCQNLIGPDPFNDATGNLRRAEGSNEARVRGQSLQVRKLPSTISMPQSGRRPLSLPPQ